MSDDNLESLSDEALSAAFAVGVAGWTRYDGNFEWDDETGCPQVDGPDYATSANAVLPWLDKCKENGLWVQVKDHTNGIDCGKRDWLVIVTSWDDCCEAPFPRDAIYAEGSAPTFPRAACLALLKARRAQKP